MALTSTRYGSAGRRFSPSGRSFGWGRFRFSTRFSRMSKRRHASAHGFSPGGASRLERPRRRARAQELEQRRVAMSIGFDNPERDRQYVSVNSMIVIRELMGKAGIH